MEEILEKISSYNLFNYLLPGIVFLVFINTFTKYKISNNNIFIQAFICYFIGLVISRFGSLIIEPILKNIFVEFSDYNDYVLASKKDTTISILSEMSNMYRTLASMLILILLLKVYEFFEIKYSKLNKLNLYILILLLLVLFLLSYKKQMDYINKRVSITINNLSKDK